MNDPLLEEWLQKAQSDWIILNRLWTQPSAEIADGVCFHAQQCVEKLLKALLIKNQQSFPRIHDLEELANRVFPFYPNLDLSMDDLEWLLDIGLRARYPGIEIVKEQADKALEICTHLRAKILPIFED